MCQRALTDLVARVHVGVRVLQQQVHHCRVAPPRCHHHGGKPIHRSPAGGVCEEGKARGTGRGVASTLILTTWLSAHLQVHTYVWCCRVAEVCKIIACCMQLTCPPVWVYVRLLQEHVDHRTPAHDCRLHLELQGWAAGGSTSLEIMRR